MSIDLDDLRRRLGPVLRAMARPAVDNKLDDAVRALMGETSKLTERVERIERHTGLDRALDALTGGKGE